MSYFKYFPKRDYRIGDTTKTVTDISKYAVIFSEIADDISFYTYYQVKPGERLDTISYRFYDTVNYYWTIPLVNSDVIGIWTNLPRDYRNLDSYLKKRYPGTALIIREDQNIAGLFGVGERIVATNGTSATISEIKPTLGYLVIKDIDGQFTENEETTVTGQTRENSTIIKNAIPYYLAPAYYENNDGERVLYDQVSIPTTLQEEAFQQNEFLSPVKIIRPEYISTVVKRFEDQMALRSRT